MAAARISTDYRLETNIECLSLGSRNLAYASIKFDVSTIFICFRLVVFFHRWKIGYTYIYISYVSYEATSKRKIRVIQRALVTCIVSRFLKCLLSFTRILFYISTFLYFFRYIIFYFHRAYIPQPGRTFAWPDAQNRADSIQQQHESRKSFLFTHKWNVICNK
jgi:hypothetical protein